MITLTGDQNFGPYLHPSDPWITKAALFGMVPLLAATACVSAVVISLNAGTNKSLYAYITAQVALCDFLMACGPMVIFVAMVTGIMEKVPSEADHFGCLSAVVLAYTTTDISACMLLLYVLASYHRIYYINVSWYQAQINKNKVELASHLPFLLLSVITIYLLDTSPALVTDLCHDMLPASLHGHTGFILLVLLFVWMGLFVCGTPIFRSSRFLCQVVRHFHDPGYGESEFTTKVKYNSQGFENDKYMKVPVRFYKLKLYDISEEEASESSGYSSKRDQMIFTEIDRAWMCSRRLPLEDYNTRKVYPSKDVVDATVPKETKNVKRFWWSSAAESHRQRLAPFLETSSTTTTVEDTSSRSDTRDSGAGRPTFLVNLLDSCEGRSRADGLQSIPPSRRTRGSSSPLYCSRHTSAVVLDANVEEPVSSGPTSNVESDLLTSQIDPNLKKKKMKTLQYSTESSTSTKRASPRLRSPVGNEADRKASDTGRAEEEEKGRRHHRDKEGARGAHHRKGSSGQPTVEKRPHNETALVERTEASTQSPAMAYGAGPLMVLVADSAEVTTTVSDETTVATRMAMEELRTTLTRTLSDSGLRVGAANALELNIGGGGGRRDLGATLLALDRGHEATASFTGLDSMGPGSNRSSRSTQTTAHRDPTISSSDRSSLGEVGKKRRVSASSPHAGRAAGSSREQHAAPKHDNAVSAPEVADGSNAVTAQPREEVNDGSVAELVAPNTGLGKNPTTTTTTVYRTRDRGHENDHYPPSRLGIDSRNNDSFPNELALPAPGKRRHRKYAGIKELEERPLNAPSPHAEDSEAVVGPAESRDSRMDASPPRRVIHTSSAWEMIRQKRRERHAKLLAQLGRGPAVTEQQSSLDSSQPQGRKSSLGEDEDIETGYLPTRAAHHKQGGPGRSSGCFCIGSPSPVVSVAGGGDDGKAALKTDKGNARAASSKNGCRGTAHKTGDNICLSDLAVLLTQPTQPVGERGRVVFWRLCVLVCAYTALWLPVLLYVQMAEPGEPFFLLPLHAALLLLSWLRPLVGSTILLWITLNDR